MSQHYLKNQYLISVSCSAKKQINGKYKFQMLSGKGGEKYLVILWNVLENKGMKKNSIDFLYRSTTTVILNFWQKDTAVTKRWMFRDPYR